MRKDKFPPTKKSLRAMYKFLKENKVSYRFYTSLPREVYVGYIWSLYWYTLKQKNKFYELPRYGLFMEHALRDTPLLDIYYQRVRGTRNISLEDFIVHLHYWGDTFSKKSSRIKKDLRKLSSEDYQAVLDSILYKDIIITYLPKVRKRLLIGLKKGTIYTIGRVTHSLRKNLHTLGTKYLSKKEYELVYSDKLVGIVCNRITFYKDLYG